MTQKSSSFLAHGNACQLLYNADFLQQPNASMLQYDIFQQADNCQKITAGGRGQAWFIEISGVSAVLRSYQRGGFIAKFNRQTYLSIEVENTRSFKEWRLLQWMYDKGLPVPQPIAASVCRWPFSFSPFYRAHILLQRIADTQTLDQLLQRQQPEDALWHSIGVCIRQFHERGIYHADLNANNILLDKQRVYLIDFDKAERRTASAHNAPWKKANLQRLKRSLLKQQGLSEVYFFTEQNWQLLVMAYKENQSLPFVQGSD